MPKEDSKSPERIVGSWDARNVDVEDDDDDSDFMEKVNVYLYAREDPSNKDSNNKALESILRRNSSTMSKSVSFAVDGVDAGDDSCKSKPELMAKISRLTELLRQAEEVTSIEKDKRKKKEKNLLKLAKELKKRIAQQAADKERIEELEEKKRYLEHHWVLAGKELDQEKILRQRLQKDQETDYDRAVRMEREKGIQLGKQYERQIEKMKRAHAKQCDELSREILKANLEADRLHNQLVGSPRRTKLFATTTRWERFPLGVVAVSMILAVVMFAAFNAQFFSLDTICSPVMPGRILRRADAEQTFQAPWWAPSPLKEISAVQFCGGSAVTLQWAPDGIDQKLVLTKDQKVILKKSAVVKAEMYGDGLRTWTRKGLAEDHRSLWSV